MTTCTTCGRTQHDEHVSEDRCVGCSLAVRQRVVQRAQAAANARLPVGVAAEEAHYAAQRHLYRTMDPAPAPAPENRPC